MNYLQENPQEIDTLFNELLIGVTKFFRDSAAFDSLKNKLSQVIQSKTKKESVRVWVAGCSTGEEAYSVAMLLVECLDTYKNKDIPPVQIYATDLDPDALDIARVGVYHSNIVADVSPERIERFFIKKDEQYSVKKELREMIVFAQQNLIKDAPFIRLDLLCCRNMLIYFTTELQRKIIPLFYYALNPNGIMFMGPAETIGGFTNMFAAIDPKWKLFERKKGNIQMHKIIDFPFHVAKQSLNITKTENTGSPVNDKSVVTIFNKILIDKFTPASVMVNEKGDILYSNGKSGKYLELPSGEAVMNIHKMAREELKYVIGNCIHQALTQEGMISTEAIKLKEDKHTRLVSLKATSLREAGMEELILLVFEDQGLVGKKQRTEIAAIDTSDAKELEKELVYTKQRLNNTIEQMETSLEELKSTNEELQSTNEELQSTNEESLTTKEEMQSLNEELMTMNMQYQAKAEELTRLNNDMKNLLDATEIGTMFLDNNLDILRYTPQVRKLFNLIPTDVGRPIMHVVSNFENPFNENDIKEVIDKLIIKEIDVRTKNSEWYRVRIMPYRTLDNFISGAVLTFTLVTDYKQMQSRLQVLQDYSAGLMNTIGDAVIQLDIKLSVLVVNNSFLKLFQVTEKEVFGRSLGGFLEARWKTEIPNQLLNKCLATKKKQSTLINIGGKEQKTFELIVTPFAEETNTTPLIVVMINEQKESKK